MKIISWNIAGLKANVDRGSFDVFYESLPDVICFQEIRTAEHIEAIPGYEHYYNPSKLNPSLSGTGLLTLDKEVKSISYDISDDEELNNEGRVITVELDELYIVNTYAPSTVNGYDRKILRSKWDKAYKEHIMELNYYKPVIACGDFNTILSPLDTYEGNRTREKEEEYFMADETNNLLSLLDNGFIDAFRDFNPNLKNAFTWWNNKSNSRKINRGTRLDYFFVSDDIIDKVKKVSHFTNVMGSDHCPIGIEVTL